MTEKMKARKTRADSALGGLSPAEADDIFVKCEAVSLADGAAWLQEKYGIRISAGRLGKWLERERTERAIRQMVDRLRADRDMAARVAETAATGSLGDANAALLQQLVFDYLRSGAAAAADDGGKALASLLGAALKVRDQELKARSMALDERKVKMLEAKAAAADAAGAVLSSKLSVYEQQKRLREILA